MTRAGPQQPIDAARIRSLRGNLRWSQADLAAFLGLADERTIRRIERQEIDPRTGEPHPISGPAQVALSYLQQGVLDEIMREIVPEFVCGDDASFQREHDYLIRLWYPRFLGLVVPSGTPGIDSLDQIPVGLGEVLVVPLWIDPPGERVGDVMRRAAAAFTEYDSAAGGHGR